MLMDIVPFSMVDYPGLIAATIFFSGCNFRCGYCHNPSLVTVGEEQVISAEEAISFLQTRTGLLDGVCLTGGEPLLSLESYALAKEIKGLGFKLKLDTNGSNLDKLKEIAPFLDYIALDIKSTPEKYEQLTKSPGSWAKVEQTVAWLKESGIDHEFRTTVLPVWHSREDLKEIRNYLGAGEKWILQQFREPPGGVLDGKNYEKFSDKEIKEMAEQLGCEIRGSS